MAVIPADMDLCRLTMDGFAELLAGKRPIVVIVPVGAVEPHGPHLSLGTDIVISRGAAIRACERIKAHGLTPLIAPEVSYGVTECAAAFKGAVSVSAEALQSFLKSVVEGLLANGVAHVCLVNNHLEPGHVSAVQSALEGIESTRASVASPIDKRWARTLSDEFKSGACHAGCYETSIMLATEPDFVSDAERLKLPAVPVSLSEKLGRGVTDFVEMGLSHAYAGSPADATAAHGDEQLDKLATMISTVIVESLDNS